MARASLKAQFFVSPDGAVIPKASPLNFDQRKAVYIRDGGECKECDRRVKFGGNRVSPFDEIASGHVDHIFPRARGGQNDPENLRLLCQSCNAAKGAY